MELTVVICAINRGKTSIRHYSDCQNIGEFAKSVVFLTHDPLQKWRTIDTILRTPIL